jgi:hypothetical protein
MYPLVVFDSTPKTITVSDDVTLMHKSDLARQSVGKPFGPRTQTTKNKEIN